MAGSPFSPWRTVDPDGPPLPPELLTPEQARIPAIYRQCGQLYRELIKVNISPYEADRLELWQIAELMTGGSESDSPSAAAYDRDADTALRQRVQQLREETPPENEVARSEPEPEPDHEPVIFAVAEPYE